MKKSVFLVLLFVLVGIFSFAACMIYTIHLNPYYSGAFFYIPPSGAVLNGHSVSANETISLSKNPPSSLKKYPNASNAMYGVFKIGGEKFYVVVGSENGKLMFFISKDGKNVVNECDKIRNGLTYTIKEGSSFTSYETLVNIHVHRNGVEYTYPIMTSISMKNGKVLSPMYYWTASFMEGTLNVKGKIHTIILGNFNGNGVYEDKMSDVINVDALNFSNPNSIFYPATSLIIGTKHYKVISISPAGTEMKIEATNEIVKAYPTIVGKDFPNLKMEFYDGTQRTLNSFKDNFVVLYFWKVPYNFALEGPDVTVRNEMLNELKVLFNKYEKDGLRVIIAPMYKSYQTPIEYEEALNEMMKYNGFNFYILNSQSTKSILNALGLNPYCSHLYILGKNNILLLKSPVLVRNIFQSFNNVFKSSSEVASFIESLF